LAVCSSYSAIHKVGSQLLILHANPTQGIPSLAAALNAQAVFWNGMWNLIPNVIVLLWKPSSKGIQVLPQNWDQLLHAPEEIRTGSTRATRFILLLAQLGSKLKAGIAAKCRGLTAAEKMQRGLG